MRTLGIIFFSFIFRNLLMRNVRKYLLRIAVIIFLFFFILYLLQFCMFIYLQNICHCDSKTLYNSEFDANTVKNNLSLVIAELEHEINQLKLVSSISFFLEHLNNFEDKSEAAKREVTSDFFHYAICLTARTKGGPYSISSNNFKCSRLVLVDCRGIIITFYIIRG